MGYNNEMVQASKARFSENAHSRIVDLQRL